MKLLVIFVSTLAIAHAIVPEKGWLRDLNSDHERRNLEAGLPNNLHFRLRREGGASDVTLHLSENTRLNANAPVFEALSLENGKQKLVKKENLTLLKTKFYHDQTNGGSFQVTCENRPDGACQRKLNGNLMIGDRAYDIISDSISVSGDLDVDEVPHILTESSNNKDNTKKNTNGNLHMTDSVDVPETNITKDELLEELKSLLSQEQIDNIEKKMQHTSRNKRGTRQRLMALEVLVVVDPIVWQKFRARTDASSSDTTRDQTTEFRLRQHYSHIINGISLRYESIEDSELRIYVTLSGFIFYKTIDSTNPLPPATNTPVVNGVKYADATTYIDSLKAWSETLDGLPHNDHIAVFTGYDLYNGQTSNNGVVGKAFVKGVCKRHYRTSVIEDGGYYTTVFVASHEIGHNLGSHHDGAGTSSECDKKSMYIMSSSFSCFYSYQSKRGMAYSVNPWRFSPCSVKAFKTYIKGLSSGNCLLDHGDYYDHGEYREHLTHMPGELYSLDEQCRLIRGENSGLCRWQNPKWESLCRVMRCQLTGSRACRMYSPARGTPCGKPTANKWCIEGKCKVREGNGVGRGGLDMGNTTSTSTTTTTTTTTPAPVLGGNCKTPDLAKCAQWPRKPYSSNSDLWLMEYYCLFHAKKLTTCCHLCAAEGYDMG